MRNEQISQKTVDVYFCEFGPLSLSTCAQRFPMFWLNSFLRPRECLAPTDGQPNLLESASNFILRSLGCCKRFGETMVMGAKIAFKLFLKSFFRYMCVYMCICVFRTHYQRTRYYKRYRKHSATSQTETFMLLLRCNNETIQKHTFQVYNN